MSLSLTQVSFSFLASGPTFDLQLPTDFDFLPELSSPLSNGVGGRTFTFFPASREMDVASSSRFLGTVVGGDGKAVEVYKRNASPLMWWLRWQLSKGSLLTHLREEDEVDGAKLVAENLSVVEAVSGVPTLLPYPPLRLVASERPGWQETATFFSPIRVDWSVSLQRPGFLQAGQEMILPGWQIGGQVVIRAGTAQGVEVQVMSGTDLAGGQSLLESVVASFKYA